MFSRAVAASGYKQWQESLALGVLFSEGVFIYFSATFKGSFFTNFGILSIKTSGIKKKSFPQVIAEQLVSNAPSWVSGDSEKWSGGPRNARCHMSNLSHLHHWSQVARSGQLHAKANVLLLRQRQRLTAAFCVPGPVDRFFFFFFYLYTSF